MLLKKLKNFNKINYRFCDIIWPIIQIFQKGSELMDEQEVMMESLATPDTPIDIQVLDCTVRLMNGTDPISQKARDIIDRFSLRPDSWSIVNDVLNSEQCSYNTKFIALRILRNTIQSSWSEFDQQTKDSIIQFILPQSISLANSNAEQSCINMADEVIVEILKFEWPNNYPNFIDELLQSMSESKNSFRNGVIILKELASDIYDYNDCGITSERSIEMTDAFEQQFPQIFEFISSVFINQDKNILSDPLVVHSTLKALKSFVPLVDIRFFIATQLFPILCDNYLSDDSYIFDVIEIFSEISTAVTMPPEFRELIPDIFKSVVQGLGSILSTNSNGENEPEEESKSPISSLSEDLIQILANSLTSFLDRFSYIILPLDDGIWARSAVELIIQITETSNEDAFQTCLEFWMKVTRNCHTEFLKQATNSENSTDNLSFYCSFFSELEQILITRFVCPYEIIRREDEDGIQWDEVIETKSPLYSPMKNSIGFLTKLNSSEVFSLLMNLPNSEQNDQDALNLFTCIAACLNSPLCDEFTVSAFEIATSSANEIGRSFLWLVSQNSRFLSLNLEILQAVIQNVIAFLSDDDLRAFAIFALKSLASDEKFIDQFIANQLHEPLINSLLAGEMLTDDFIIDPASKIIADAINKGDEGNQVNDEEKERLLSLLLDSNDAKWSEISSNLDPSNTLPVILTMRAYGKAAYNLGPLFISHITKILPSFIEAHKFFASVTASTNEQAIIIRQVKTSIVTAIELFAKKLSLCPPVVVEFVITQCLPLAEDFANSQKEARDPALLRLFGLLCEKNGSFLNPQMDTLFSLLFIPTMNIVTNSEEQKNSFGSDGSCDSFDEDVINMHRSALLSFIDGTVKGCIDFIASFNEGTLNSFVETFQLLTSFLTKQEISTKSIKILTGFVESVKNNASQDFISLFTSNYAINLVIDFFRIVIDPCYNFAFSEICSLLQQLLSLPIIKENAPDLASTLQQNLFHQIDESFLLEIVSSLIQSIEEKLIFRQNLRDFLIQIKKIGRNDEFFRRDEIEIEKMELNQQIQNEMQMNMAEA